jgi:hypothetical protein
LLKPWFMRAAFMDLVFPVRTILVVIALFAIHVDEDNVIAPGCRVFFAVATKQPHISTKVLLESISFALLVVELVVSILSMLLSEAVTSLLLLTVS